MSNDPQHLYSELTEAGVTLSIDARDRLRVSAPSGILTAELSQRIRDHKPALVEIIKFSHCQSCGWPEFVDSPIHDGRSLRRDCAHCGRTAGFLIWYGIESPAFRSQLVSSTH